MSDLGWRADGIARAKAAGGIELELYRRPGFTGGKSVRRVDAGSGAGGGFSHTDDPWDDDDETDRRSGKGHAGTP